MSFWTEMLLRPHWWPDLLLYGVAACRVKWEARRAFEAMLKEWQR